MKSGRQGFSDQTIGDSTFSIGFLLALAGSMGCGLHAALVSNFLGKTAPESLILAQALAGFPLAALTALIDPQAKTMSSTITNVTFEEWLIFTSNALLALLGFAAVLAALKLTDPTVVTSIGASQIIFAFLIQIFIMQSEAEVMELLGAAIIFIVVLLIPFENELSTMRGERG